MQSAAMSFESIRMPFMDVCSPLSNERLSNYATSFGCRSETRDRLGHKLGVLSQATHFLLHPRAQALPPNYRLATRHDVAMYKQFLWEVVPSGEVAYLEDGWVDSGYLQCLTG